MRKLHALLTYPNACPKVNTPASTPRTQYAPHTNHGLDEQTNQASILFPRSIVTFVIVKVVISVTLFSS